MTIDAQLQLLSLNACFSPEVSSVMTTTDSGGKMAQRRLKVIWPSFARRSSLLWL